MQHFFVILSLVFQMKSDLDINVDLV